MAASRRLIVMRHAKAGELPGGPDAERELRPRGRRDAAAAGTWLAAQGLIPGLVLCSAARRARQTWAGAASGLGAAVAEVEVRFDQRLYSADAEALLAVIGETPASRTSLMYLGHNPAAADLTRILLARPVDFPTAALAVIDLEVAWDTLADPSAAAGTGALAASWNPGSGA